MKQGFQLRRADSRSYHQNCTAPWRSNRREEENRCSLREERSRVGSSLFLDGRHLFDDWQASKSLIFTEMRFYFEFYIFLKKRIFHSNLTKKAFLIHSILDCLISTKNKSTWRILKWDLKVFVTHKNICCFFILSTNHIMKLHILL